MTNNKANQKFKTKQKYKNVNTHKFPLLNNHIASLKKIASSVLSAKECNKDYSIQAD